VFWRTAEAYFQSLRFAPDDAVREKIRERGQGTISDVVIRAEWAAVIHARDHGGLGWFPGWEARIGDD
jgi:hypothetical protein